MVLPVSFTIAAAVISAAVHRSGRSVVMVMALMAEFLDHLAVDAGGALHLDGGVGDPEALRQQVLDAVEDR